MLELFYHDVMEIEPNNRDRKKDLTKEKLRSYIYTTPYDKITKAQKNWIKFQNRPENLF